MCVLVMPLSEMLQSLSRMLHIVTSFWFYFPKLSLGFIFRSLVLQYLI